VDRRRCQRRCRWGSRRACRQRDFEPRAGLQRDGPSLTAASRNTSCACRPRFHGARGALAAGVAEPVCEQVLDPLAARFVRLRL